MSNSTTTKKKLSRGARIAIIVPSVIVGLIALLLIAAYVFMAIIYPEVQPADTTIHDLTELAALFREDLDADASGYTDEQILSAKSAIVLEKIESLPGIDYTQIVSALEKDGNADLSAYGFTKYEEQVVRYAVIFGYHDRLYSLMNQQTILPPDYGLDDPITGDEETTESPETTADPDTTREPETTLSPETTESPETTGAPDTTMEPETTLSPETTESPETTGAPDTTKAPVTQAPVTQAPVTPSITVIENPGTEPPPITGQTITDEDIYNVLIIGTDSRSLTNLAGRSDTIIVASINRVSKRIVLTSFQRDTIVKDPELGGYAKINAFFARSGTVGQRAGRLINVLKHNFDITIHNYVVVNFNAFTEIIDIFGGVQVPLYYSEYLNLSYTFTKEHPTPVRGLDSLYTDKANGYIWVKLNAEQALFYARMRSNLWNPVSKKYQRSDDSFRTERQRYVIRGLFSEVRKLSFDELLEIANKIFSQITTDLPLNDFLVKIMGYTDFAKYSTHMLNASGIRYSWYPCTTDGYKVYFQGDAGYGKGQSGVGILEYPYRDGYAIIKSTWRAKVYQ